MEATYLGKMTGSQNQIYLPLMLVRRCSKDELWPKRSPDDRTNVYELESEQDDERS